MTKKWRQTFKYLEAVNYYHKALHLGCCSSPRSASDSNEHKLPNYIGIYETRSPGKIGGGLSIRYSVRKDFSTNSEDIEHPVQKLLTPHVKIY